MSYLKYNVNLTQGQKHKLLNSYNINLPATIRLKKNQIMSGNDALILTQRQINKILKSKKNGLGTDIKFSPQLTKQQGSGFLSALIPALAKVGSMAIPYITKAAAPLATGALSGLASLGVNKLFGSGLFSVPQDKVDKLIKYKNYLTLNQKKQIVSALQNGSGFNLKLTKKQQTQEGGFLLSALASLAIPMIIKAVTGQGLQVEPKKIAKGLQIEKYSRPPPFYGQWSQGYGIKKKRKKKSYKKGKRIDIRQEQPIQRDPIIRRSSLKFINKPLSNFDLIKWVKKLNIKYFRAVYSRDNLPKKIMKKECGIINLNKESEYGSHWVCYRNINGN